MSSGTNCSSTATTIHTPTSANAVPASSRSPTASPPTPSPTTACSAHATPTRPTPGSPITRSTDSPASSATSMAVPAGAIFSRTAEVQERLRQGPGPEARQEAAALSDGPTPSRWTLRTIRVTFDWLAGYTPSGVWRLLDRLGLRLRSARVQQYSPDPEYAAKVAHLEMALWEARRFPRSVAA